MSTRQAELLRIAAAEETIQRIRKDRNRVSAQLRPILRYLEDHVFDPALQVQTMMRACGVRDKQMPSLFAAELDLTPWQYVIDCRMEVAARMLVNSKLPAWAIGASVGYPVPGTFSDAFELWSGQRPSAFRKNPQKRVPAERLPNGDLIGGAEVLAALEGKLKPEEAENLRYRLRAIDARLEAIYPNLSPRSLPQLKPVIGAEFTEKVMAQKLWEMIKDDPVDNQRAIVRSQLCFTTPALADLLCEKSREVGREDRQRGVGIAELALDALHGMEKLGSPGVSSLKAKVWAWIGHSRRMAHDYRGAAKAINCAEAELSVTAEDCRDSLVVAEVILSKATLCFVEKKLDESIALAGSSIEMLRKLDNPSRLAQALILRGITVGFARGAKNEIRDFLEAKNLLKEDKDMYLALVAQGNLAAAYLRAEDYESASRELPAAKSLCIRSGNTEVWAKLIWLEGLLHQQRGHFITAENYLVEARQIFRQTGRSTSETMIAIDLSILFSKQGREVELAGAVSEAIKGLREMPDNQGAYDAADALKLAVESNNLSLEILDLVRTNLYQTGEDPTAWLA